LIVVFSTELLLRDHRLKEHIGSASGGAKGSGEASRRSSRPPSTLRPPEAGVTACRDACAVASNATTSASCCSRRSPSTSASRASTRRQGARHPAAAPPRFLHAA